MLPYGKQYIDQADIDAVVTVMQSDLLTTGPEVGRLEAALQAETGAAHAVASANGTAALHLACLAMGLSVDDQVIVPSISFVATANAPRYCGADVVFADVDPDTSLMTPATLEAAIERADRSRLKAVFVVHMGGHCAELGAIRAITDGLGIYLIEDACHALGSTYRTSDGQTHKVLACAHSDFATLSMHPVKTITCGEGGVTFTAHERFARAMQTQRTHGLLRDADQWQDAGLALDADTGRANGWYYELQDLGFNYRLTDFQAALAASQLKKLPSFAERRRRLAALYRTRCSGHFEHLTLVAEPDYSDSVLHLMVALIDFAAIGKSRHQVMSELVERGVGSQVHYIPIHRQPYYAKLNPGLELPGADTYYGRCLSLPLYAGMSDDDVDTVVGVLKDVVG